MAAGPQLLDGWLVVPFGGDDAATVLLGVAPGSAEPALWTAAFLDYDADGQRIAKIRPPSLHVPRLSVWQSVAGQRTRLGRLP